MEPVTEGKYRGFTIQVYLDEDPPSPREWDNLGTMVCFHRRYDLGDLGGPRRSFQGLSFAKPEDFDLWLRSHPSLILPLYLYDHSGLVMGTSNSGWPFNCPWDAGQVGWIFTEIEKAKQEYKTAGLTWEELKKSVHSLLRAEVKTYSQYLSGEVYGWVILTPQGDRADSCWGYFGHELENNGLFQDARDSIDAFIQKAMKARAEKIKSWIRHRVPFIYRTPMAL